MSEYSSSQGAAPDLEGQRSAGQSEFFTLVFSGDLTAFDGNPHKTDTPFGRPIRSALGDVMDASPDYDHMLAEEGCSFIRAAAKRVTGGNCAFIDDDVNLLEHLAQRAVDAGLTDRLHPSVQKSITRGGRNPNFASSAEPVVPQPRDEP